MGIHYEQVRYLASYGTVEQLPQSKAPEVSFVGRSNVGKSSLINKLFNRKSLAGQGLLAARQDRQHQLLRS